jgi:hypothetical protein
VKAWYRKRAVTVVSIALLVLALAVFGLQAWLSSGIGRGVVESRLSEALGRPARLEGEFRLRLLPRPGVRGTSLKIYTRDGRWVFLDAGAYLARLSLWPLFNGEVVVLALEIEDAGVDISRLDSEPSGGDDDSPHLQLPQIRSFELADVAVYFDGMGSEPYLNVEQLSIDRFEIDSSAPFETRLSLASADSAGTDLFGEGQLILNASGEAEVSLSRVDLSMEGWEVRSLEGRVSASLLNSTVDLELEWQDPEQSVHIASEVNWEPGYPQGEEGFAIERLEWSQDGSRISGKGCLMSRSPPGLNLQLESAQLDMDALLAVIRKWQASPSSTPELAVTPGQDSSQAEFELPFDLDLSLDVERATMGDAVAHGARLKVGARPQCPDVL